MISYDAFNLNMRASLDFPLEEGTGLVVNCRSKFVHNGALSGPPTFAQLANGYPYLSMDATNPDFIEVPGADTTELDYTAGDFGMAAWVLFHSLALGPMIFCRGLLDTDGYYFRIEADGTIALVTNQAGGNQVSESAAGAIVLETWYQIAATRSGADVLVYRNGVDVTTVSGTHVDPLTSARKLIIGAYDDEASNGYHGHLARPRMCSNQPSAADISRLFETEQGWFGA